MFIFFSQKNINSGVVAESYVQLYLKIYIFKYGVAPKATYSINKKFIFYL
jgi:hypothetical protein